MINAKGVIIQDDTDEWELILEWIGDGSLHEGSGVQLPAWSRGKPTEPCYLSDFISYHSPLTFLPQPKAFAFPWKYQAFFYFMESAFAVPLDLSVLSQDIHIPTPSLLVSLHSVQPFNRESFPNHHTPLCTILTPAPSIPFPLIMVFFFFGLYSKIVPGPEQIL